MVEMEYLWLPVPRSILEQMCIFLIYCHVLSIFRTVDSYFDILNLLVAFTFLIQNKFNIIHGIFNCFVTDWLQSIKNVRFQIVVEYKYMCASIILFASSTKLRIEAVPSEMHISDIWCLKKKKAGNVFHSIINLLYMLIWYIRSVSDN